MSEWFYAGDNREPCGPLDAEQLRALHRSGRITGDTLVWRQGMGSWQRLASCQVELGLEGIAPPAPPLPPPVEPQPHPTPAIQAASVPGGGLSGCGLVAIIAAVGGVLLLFVLAILAAIAIPAYNDYLLRSRASEAIAQLGPVKGQVTGFVQDQGRCPVNDDAPFRAAEQYASGNLGDVRIGRFDNGHCGLEARLHLPGKALHDAAIWLDYDPEQRRWTCRSEAPDKYLPSRCRG